MIATGQPNEPTAELAVEIATEVIGQVPMSVQRFTTGARHYVYDVVFVAHPPVVIRIGSRSACSEMAGAVHLSGLLRPHGVPLPALLAHNAGTDFPWLALERLSGTDLGAVIAGFSDDQLDRIAATVAQAQAVTARIGSAGRYGYAVRPEQAPHDAWSDVLQAHLARSGQRIAAAGLFDTGLIDRARTILTAMRAALDAIAATPFLHDTTTKNVIVTANGTVSGIVDVDDLCFGDPRFPAALTLAVLIGYGGPTRYVSAWLHHARQPDDPIFRLYVTLFLLDLMAEHGQVFNGNEQPSSPMDRAILGQAFEKSLEHIRS